MKGFIMDKDSAIRICNSTYSIMLGFVVNNIFLLQKDWANYEVHINIATVIMFVYYIIDWFTYNALATIDKNQESIETFFTIIFIIFLGWLMVFINNLSEYNCHTFIMTSAAYLFLSSALFILRLNSTLEENWHIDLKKNRYVIIDMALRILVGIIALGSAANRSSITNYRQAFFAIVIFSAIIVTIKIVKYLELVKIIKAKQ